MVYGKFFGSEVIVSMCFGLEVVVDDLFLEELMLLFNFFGFDVCFIVN